MRKYSTAGLSLLEIMIAAVILVVAFIPVFNIFSRGQSDTLESEAIGIITRLGQTGSDEINAITYRELEKELLVKEGTLDLTQTYEFKENLTRTQINPNTYTNYPINNICRKLFESACDVRTDSKLRPPTMLSLETTLALSPGDGIIKATIIFKWKQKKKGKLVNQEVKVSTLSVKFSSY
ncbi:hypothetical protein KAJ27_14330 [bacterium]|nr:hypothetical protein [bacterium]